MAGLLTKQITSKINCKAYRDYMGRDSLDKKLIELKSHEKLPYNKFILRYVYQNKTYTKIVTMDLSNIENCKNDNESVLSTDITCCRSNAVDIL